jgi:hypothetical protein
MAGRRCISFSPNRIGFHCMFTCIDGLFGCERTEEWFRVEAHAGSFGVGRRRECHNGRIDQPFGEKYTVESDGALCFRWTPGRSQGWSVGNITLRSPKSSRHGFATRLGKLTTMIGQEFSRGSLSARPLVILDGNQDHLIPIQRIVGRISYWRVSFRFMFHISFIDAWRFSLLPCAK